MSVLTTVCFALSVTFKTTLFLITTVDILQKSLRKVIAVNRLAVLAKKGSGNLAKDVLFQVWSWYCSQMNSLTLCNKGYPPPPAQEKSTRRNNNCTCQKYYQASTLGKGDSSVCSYSLLCYTENNHSMHVCTSTWLIKTTDRSQDLHDCMYALASQYLKVMLCYVPKLKHRNKK